MIMHRDIKPDNILIDKDGINILLFKYIGNVKIADFGLSKRINFAAKRNSN
jgi:serine/threonine protein kinase